MKKAILVILTVLMAVSVCAACLIGCSRAPATPDVRPDATPDVGADLGGGDAASPEEGGSPESPEEVPAPSESDGTYFKFGGWYTSPDFSGEPLFSLSVVETEGLYAKWESVTIDYAPFEENGDRYVYYGTFPQTALNLEQSASVAEQIKGKTPDANGYFTVNLTIGEESKSVKVFPASGYVLDAHYRFDNGELIENATTYYFLVEPIKWKILSSDASGKSVLLSEKLLLCEQYSDRTETITESGLVYHPNNWSKSKLRATLNGTFLRRAFSAEEQNVLQTVSNYDSGSNAFYETYATDTTTEDKVYVPSYADMVNTAYGFSSDFFTADAARTAITTDYARIQNSWIDKRQGDGFGKSVYWLRSPGQVPRYNSIVYFDGKCGQTTHWSDTDFVSVRPMVTAVITG